MLPACPPENRSGHPRNAWRYHATFAGERQSIADQSRNWRTADTPKAEPPMDADPHRYEEGIPEMYSVFHPRASAFIGGSAFGVLAFSVSSVRTKIFSHRGPRKHGGGKRQNRGWTRMHADTRRDSLTIFGFNSPAGALQLPCLLPHSRYRPAITTIHREDFSCETVCFLSLFWEG